jgi:hypothetical protein
MANGITFSTNWSAVKQRIRKIPKIAEGVADMQRSRDADELIAIWRTGLINNSFSLIPLKPDTRARKARLGYRYPSSPLYGLGLEGSKTYIKGMRKFKTKRGYTVHMINGKHHQSKLPLSALFVVHEYGATIKAHNGKLIVIPARPAMQKSYTRLLNRLKANDPTIEFTKAVNQYIAEGRHDLINKITSRAKEAEARNA